MAKDWPAGTAAGLVRLLYKRVLERDVDDSGLITWGCALDNGELSVKEIVRRLGKSDEYRSRFVIPFSPAKSARLMYQHFLARQPESDKVVEGWADVISDEGWQVAVDGFVDSAEYGKRFGDNKVPA